MQPKADNQGSKNPFRDYRWVGRFIVQRVLPNGKNYIVRLLNTNKTQILHRIRLKRFVPNQPLGDNCREERLEHDEEIVILQDDLYTITWETNFGQQLVTRGNEQPILTSLPKGAQLITPNTDLNDAEENKVDYIISNDGLNDVNLALQQRNERLHYDVSRRHKATEAEKNENSDLPDLAVCPKHQKKTLPVLSGRQKTMPIFWKAILFMKTMHMILQRGGWFYRAQNIANR